MIPTPPFSPIKVLGAKFKSASNRAAPCCMCLTHFITLIYKIWQKLWLHDSTNVRVNILPETIQFWLCRMQFLVILKAKSSHIQTYPFTNVKHLLVRTGIVVLGRQAPHEIAVVPSSQGQDGVTLRRRWCVRVRSRWRCHRPRPGRSVWRAGAEPFMLDVIVVVVV